MNTKLFLRICLHLYGTRHRVALVSIIVSVFAILANFIVGVVLAVVVVNGFVLMLMASFAPNTHHSSTVSSSTPSHPRRALSLSRDQFLSRLKTHLFTLSYPP